MLFVENQYEILVVSSNISISRLTTRIKLKGKLKDYQYRFRALDDDDILYFSGVTTDESMMFLFETLQRDYGVTRLDTKPIGSKEDYSITIG